MHVRYASEHTFLGDLTWIPTLLVVVGWLLGWLAELVGSNSIWVLVWQCSALLQLSLTDLLWGFICPGLNLCASGSVCLDRLVRNLGLSETTVASMYHVTCPLLFVPSGLTQNIANITEKTWAKPGHQTTMRLPHL